MHPSPSSELQQQYDTQRFCTKTKRTYVGSPSSVDHVRFQLYNWECGHKSPDHIMAKRLSHNS